MTDSEALGTGSTGAQANPEGQDGSSPANVPVAPGGTPPASMAEKAAEAAATSASTDEPVNAVITGQVPVASMSRVLGKTEEVTDEQRRSIVEHARSLRPQGAVSEPEDPEDTGSA